jgi:hypothetical protein
MLWELPIETRSVNELSNISEMLSGNQKYFMEGVMPLTLRRTPEILRRTWEFFFVSHPTDVIASSDDVINWYLREAEASERAEQWNAAVFHWGCLTNAEPTNRFYLDRLNRAQDLAKRPEALPRP